jgi:hypothetical protein
VSGRPVTLLRAGLPRWLERRVVVIPPGGALAYAAEDWLHALAVVEEGSVVLDGACGRSVRLEQGAVFSLGGGKLTAIRNDTADAAVIATARRHSDS